MHAAHGALARGHGVVDLRDGLAPTGGVQFLSAEQACEEASVIAKPLPRDALQARKRQIGDGKPVHASAS
jgi:hypothetical protein